MTKKNVPLSDGDLDSRRHGRPARPAPEATQALPRPEHRLGGHTVYRTHVRITYFIKRSGRFAATLQGSLK
jgi:hypothetical protein